MSRIRNRPIVDQRESWVLTIGGRNVLVEVQTIRNGRPIRSTTLSIWRGSEIERRRAWPTIWPDAQLEQFAREFVAEAAA